MSISLFHRLHFSFIASCGWKTTNDDVADHFAVVMKMWKRKTLAVEALELLELKWQEPKSMETVPSAHDAIDDEQSHQSRREG